MTPYRRRAHYYETDKMGVIHHANYIHWMEEARVAWLEELGWPFEKLEALGVVSPVTAVECRYVSPCRFAQEVEVALHVTHFDGVKLRIGYQITRCPTGETLCTGCTEHCFLSPEGRFLRLRRDYPDFYRLLTECAQAGA